MSTKLKPSGSEQTMHPKPITDDPRYRPSDKLKNKVALVTGGDSGIGKAICTLFAKEGADIAFVYMEEHADANEVKHTVTDMGRDCISIAGDLGSEAFCRQVIDDVVKHYGKIDILINNAGTHVEQQRLEDISEDQLRKTFEANIFSMFFLTKAALPHMKAGSSIINTTSITAYEGSAHLMDYASTKGAIVAFTRSLAENLAERGIRVNGVAPGPIWTPLVVSTFTPEHLETFGKNTLLKRAGEPLEVAHCFLFLASEESSYLLGQILHPNGGRFRCT